MKVNLTLSIWNLGREKKNAVSFQHLLFGSVSASTVISMEMAEKRNLLLLFVLFLKWKLLVMVTSVYKWSVLFIIFITFFLISERSAMELLEPLFRSSERSK